MLLSRSSHSPAHTGSGPSRKETGDLGGPKPHGACHINVAGEPYSGQGPTGKGAHHCRGSSELEISGRIYHINSRPGFGRSLGPRRNPTNAAASFFAEKRNVRWGYSPESPHWMPVAQSRVVNKFKYLVRAKPVETFADIGDNACEGFFYSANYCMNNRDVMNTDDSVRHLASIAQ